MAGSTSATSKNTAARNVAGKSNDTTTATSPTVTVQFNKGQKLGPVTGRGKKPNPIPPELVTQLQDSLNSCEGKVGGDGGDCITHHVNTSGLTRLKNDVKKWRAAMESQGIHVDVRYRTNRDEPIEKDKEGEIRFAVFLTAPLPNSEKADS